MRLGSAGFVRLIPLLRNSSGGPRDGLAFRGLNLLLGKVGYSSIIHTEHSFLEQILLILIHRHPFQYDCV